MDSVLRLPLFVVLFWAAGLVSCANSSGKRNAKADSFKAYFSGKTFENLDLSTLTTGKSKPPVYLLEFDQCEFKGATTFGTLEDVVRNFPSSVSFKNCRFEDELTGNQMQFAGSVTFVKCIFKKKASFQNAVFFDQANFQECTFDGNAQFQNAVFMKPSFWVNSHFYGLSLFQAVRFYDKAQFSNSVFHGNADFTICRFEEGAAFDFIRSEGKLDLSESRQQGLLTFRKAEILKRISLDKFRSFAPVRFYDTRFEDSLSHKGARFFAENPEILRPTGGIVPSLAD